MVCWAARDKKGCDPSQAFVCLRGMEPHDVSRQFAIYYVIGIVVAAVIFRIIRSWRKRRWRDSQGPRDRRPPL